MKSRITQITLNLQQLAAAVKRPLLLFFIFLLGLTKANSQVNIVTVPSAASAAVGASFTVNVNLQFVAGSLSVVQSHFTFDNTVLQVTGVSNASSVGILPSVAFPSTYNSDPVQTIADYNTNGRVDYVASTTGPFPTTNFTLLTVTFLVTGTPGGGTTPFTFRLDPTPPPVTDIFSGATSVLGTTTNSSITITPACTPPTATIASNGSTTCNAQPFNLLLNAATGTGPWDLTINGITYNNIPVGGTITTFTPPNENIFGAADPNPTGLGNDDSYELGTKFQSSVAGYVKGVRFFSHPTAAADPAGTYTGHLWTAGGTLLASVTFTGVTSDAWQQALFSTPVEITANTTYIISYHTTSNQYVLTGTGLATAITNGTLTALDDATAGGNGVYLQSLTPGFPNATFNSSNYWVDPVFSPKEYTFELTSVVDDAGCTATGAPLQTLTVTSVNCNTLPVTLLNLSATPQDKKITVRWATDGESNNKGFDLLRSTDGINWQTIAFINGAGNSSSVKNYSYVDLNLSPKRYYYRLKQIDFDGKYKISATVSAVIDGKASFSLAQNFPNPTVGGETTIQFTLAGATKVSLSLYDMHGRLVRVLATGAKDAGSHTIPVNTGSLTSGVYYYKLQAGDFSDVKKMTIQ